ARAERLREDDAPRAPRRVRPPGERRADGARPPARARVGAGARTSSPDLDRNRPAALPSRAAAGADGGGDRRASAPARRLALAGRAPPRREPATGRGPRRARASPARRALGRRAAARGGVRRAGEGAAPRARGRADGRARREGERARARASWGKIELLAEGTGPALPAAQAPAAPAPREKRYETEVALAHVAKAYGARRLFSDLSWTFGPERLHVVAGPSGSGKTT